MAFGVMPASGQSSVYVCLQQQTRWAKHTHRNRWSRRPASRSPEVCFYAESRPDRAEVFVPLDVSTYACLKPPRSPDPVPRGLHLSHTMSARTYTYTRCLLASRCIRIYACRPHQTMPASPSQTLLARCLEPKYTVSQSCYFPRPLVPTLARCQRSAHSSLTDTHRRQLRLTLTLPPSQHPPSHGSPLSSMHHAQAPHKATCYPPLRHSLFPLIVIFAWGGTNRLFLCI